MRKIVEVVKRLGEVYRLELVGEVRVSLTKRIYSPKVRTNP